MRFFARNNRALLSTLTVEVITETSLGLKVAAAGRRPAAAADSGSRARSSSWSPTCSRCCPASTPRSSSVVRSVGLGTWYVDDFYVDPQVPLGG